jgi:hypothetical protein
MNAPNTPSRLGRVLRLVAGACLVAASMGASCLPAMNNNIDSHYVPDIIRATDAASIAGACSTRVGTPQQVAVAAAAAESSRVAAWELRIAMQDLKLAYAEKENATNARVQQDQQNANWEAQIAELQRKAGIAMTESGVDHNVRFMHGFYLPAEYAYPSPQRPNVSPFTNADFLLLGTAAREAAGAALMAKQAGDEAGPSPNATAQEVAQLNAWSRDADSLATLVAGASDLANQHKYNTPDDVQQGAVRRTYKAMELGFRARALQMQIELRGDAAERSTRAAEREAQAAAAYQAALTIAGNAQRKAADAANAAYAAAVGCGIDTAPIVPGSPEWNDTFWEISSP